VGTVAGNRLKARTRTAEARSVRVPGKAVALTVALAALAMIALTAPAAGAATTSSQALSPSRAATRDTAGFWTRARMRRARPLDLVRPGSPEEAKREDAGAAGGAPHLVPPSAPTSSAPAASDGKGATFSSFPAPDPTDYPNSTNGKVFGKLRFGIFECSATSIDAPNASVVFTAGHCVNNGRGHWYDRRWIFVPGFDHGAHPYGKFVARKLWSTGQWVHHENDNYDIGAVVVHRNGAGQRLGNAAGGRGIATGRSRDQNFQAFGYPAESPFGGRRQWECDSPWSGNDPSSQSDPGPLTTSIGCDMTGGSSGGGWIIDGQYLNGVNSYGYNDEPDTMYGPYFGSAAWRLYKDVRNR
jgi:V8-like Glu-specific endopeptidase